MENEKTKIVVLAKGPVLLEGDFVIIHPDGKEENKEGKVALCRCGYSNNKPFCDGSHKNCPTTDLI